MVVIRCGSRSGPATLRPAQGGGVPARVGDTDYADFLELVGDSRTYRKTIVAAAGRPAISLREVEIEDYAGNKARFTFDR